MKKHLLLVLLVVIFKSTLSAQNYFNYPLKTGSITYTMSMMGADNTMILYFVDNGNKQCSDVRTEMFGMKIHNRNIIVGKKTYLLDMNQKTYTERELSEEDLQKTGFYISDERMTKEEINKIGEENLLGKNCQVYSLNEKGSEVKFWLWKGLMLKMETGSEGMSVNIIATDIKELAPDKALFELPSDFSKK